MQYKTADKLQIGDIVMINKKDETNVGKQGIVCEIARMKSGKVGRIYLKPFNCEFKFVFPYSKNCANKEGLPGWHPSYLSLPNKNLRIDNEIGGGAVYINSYDTFMEKKQKIKEELNNKYGKEADPKPPLEPTNKLFYVGLMFGEDGICWPTDSFTDKELGVIERFLTEFNEHAEGKSIDCVVILDNDEGEEEE